MNAAIAVAVIDFVKSVVTKPKQHYLNTDIETLKGVALLATAALMLFGYSDAEAETGGNLIATAVVAIAGVWDFFKQTRKSE